MKNWMLWVALGAVLMLFGITTFLTIVSIVAWLIIKIVFWLAVALFLFWYFNK